ncbi:CBS domain-containing protein [Vulgatibacter incomptus]|uniref:CBS domain protein n=1 Tax=Vulgatibacter incomptus TaxID=1391653 RepID=A0A0K1PJM1_9BACT|nr:CBS domain-containing protein [Vulgatibacter incomptus]AKU93304.1 CBS domain protein [Vulgatibacter incomptus]
MKVRDLMTRDVVTLEAGENLLLADDVMRLGRIRHLPVVENGRLVGLISHRDILQASVSSLAGLSRAEDASIKKSIPAREVMKREVTTIGPDEPALVACSIVLDRKLGCLPVVDAEGALVGIVTEADFVELARRYLEQLRD